MDGFRFYVGGYCKLTFIRGNFILRFITKNCIATANINNQAVEYIERKYYTKDI